MRLTKDDERARRLCSLALEFMNAPGPVASSQLARAFYPDVEPQSFRRAFARDREALAACGIYVVEHDAGRDESTWSANADASFAQGVELAPADAAVLDVACRPLLEDADFALAGELRLALAKLDRAFAEAPLGDAAGERPEGKVLATLRGCLLAKHAAEVTYCDAAGNESVRTVAPYGFFGLRGATYLVADLVDEKGVSQHRVRTYRLDRMAKARELPRLTYSVPPSFDVADYLKLPFQMGPEVAQARFAVPAGRAEALRVAAGAQGAFEPAGGGLSEDGEKDALVWTVGVSSYRAAASWAVAQGIRPLEPAELVGAWHEVLKGVLANGQ